MTVEQTARFEEYLQEAHERGASDLYLIPGEPVAFRVRGEVERSEGDVLTAETVRAIAEAAVGPRRLAELGAEVGAVRAACSVAGVVDGRMTLAKSLGEVAIVVRLLPAKLATLAEIGLPESAAAALASPNGLIVVCGPTGSGKSTIAYAMLDHLNATIPGHICTVEDPIIMHLVPKRCIVQQREVGADVPNVVAGIRAAMLQDLDVVLVGDLRRVEELDACLTAAETGHLVIIVMHAATPAEAVQRMIDVQPEDMRPTFRRSLARTLRVVVGSYLLSRADGKGRIAAYGVLAPDPPMRQAIAEGRSVLDREALPAGCQALHDDVRRHLAAGTVTQAEADRALAAVAET